MVKMAWNLILFFCLSYIFIMEKLLVSVNQEIFPHVVSLTKVLVPGPDDIYRYKVFKPEETAHYKTKNESFFQDLPRQYKTIIGITLYNEEFSLLYQTLSGIFENKSFSSPNNELLKNTLIIIISDGYKFLSKSVSRMLTAWNLYDEDYIEEYLIKNGNSHFSFYENKENDEENDEECEENDERYEGNDEGYEENDEEYEENKENGNETENQEEQKEQEEWSEQEQDEEAEEKTQSKEIEEICFLFEGKLKYQTISEEFRETSDNSPQANNSIDVIFLTKQDNNKKLHSHLWLYKVFCLDFNPDFVVVKNI